MSVPAFNLTVFAVLVHSVVTFWLLDITFFITQGTSSVLLFLYTLNSNVYSVSLLGVKSSSKVIMQLSLFGITVKIVLLTISSIDLPPIVISSVSPSKVIAPLP